MEGMFFTNRKNQELLIRRNRFWRVGIKLAQRIKPFVFLFYIFRRSCLVMPGLFAGGLY